MDANRATRLLEEGYNCAQSVLMAVCQEHNIEVDKPEIAMCLGGGIGFMGEVCGAVTGGAMAIGMVKGPAEDLQEFQENMPVVQEFRKRFEAEMKSIHCRDLTGMSLSEPGEFEAFMESEIPEKVCAKAVHVAYITAMDVLKNDT